jgi:hypothetical protein
MQLTAAGSATLAACMFLRSTCTAKTMFGALQRPVLEKAGWHRALSQPEHADAGSQSLTLNGRTTVRRMFTQETSVDALSPAWYLQYPRGEFMRSKLSSVVLWHIWQALVSCRCVTKGIQGR